jgi:hypothetical protein
MGIPEEMDDLDQSCASRIFGAQSDCYENCGQPLINCPPGKVHDEVSTECVGEDCRLYLYGNSLCTGVDITLETHMQNTNVYTECVGGAIGYNDETEGCPVLCNEQSYSVTVSTAMWPSLVYQVCGCLYGILIKYVNYSLLTAIMCTTSTNTTRTLTRVLIGTVRTRCSSRPTLMRCTIRSKMRRLHMMYVYHLYTHIIMLRS